MQCFTIIVLFPLLIPAIARTQIQKIYLYPKATGTARQEKFVDSIQFVPLESREEVQLSAPDQYGGDRQSLHGNRLLHEDYFALCKKRAFYEKDQL